jgi:2'-5' RNA ligase
MGCREVPVELTQLVDALQGKLREREFVLEDRPFRLHITLARDARLPQRLPVERIDWNVNEFALVESTTGRGGSHYDVIGRWPLQ